MGKEKEKVEIISEKVSLSGDPLGTFSIIFMSRLMCSKKHRGFSFPSL